MRLLIAGAGPADTSIPAWRLREEVVRRGARCCSLEPRADGSTRVPAAGYQLELLR